MPELPDHRHHPRHSLLHSEGTDTELSPSLFHLPLSQMGAKPPQEDVEAVRKVGEELTATARTWVRNNMC